jgi:hypothetical protein
MPNRRPTGRNRPQRDQKCYQTQRNGNHDCQRDEAPPAGDQLSKLPLATAPRERDADVTRQPGLGGRDAERALPRETAKTHSVLPMSKRPSRSGGRAVRRTSLTAIFISFGGCRGGLHASGMISTSASPSRIVTRATLGCRSKRLGPAAPGFTAVRLASSRTISARCVWPKTTTSP